MMHVMHCFAKSHHSYHQLKMHLASIQAEQITRLLFGYEPLMLGQMYQPHMAMVGF